MGEKTLLEFCIEQAREDCPDAHPEDYINSLTNMNLIRFLEKASDREGAEGFSAPEKYHG